jgi:hypothetical protein
MLLAVITFFAGCIIGSLAKKQFSIGENIGEARVVTEIETHFSRMHVLLNNVTLPTENGTTQIDHILIADTGIFVIETKHYKGWIYGNPSEATWTQVVFKLKSGFQNPLRQNYGHLKTLQALFNLPDDNFLSVVVFSGEADFKSFLGDSVFKLGELSGYLAKPRPVVFDERKIAYIVGRIEMKRLRRSIETDEYHVNSLRKRTTQRGYVENSSRERY